MVEEPDRRRNPDERRADRHGRKHEGREAKKRRGWNASDPESDSGNHTLGDRGPDDSVDDPSHRVARDTDEMLAPFSRDAPDRGIEPRRERFAVAIEEEDDEDRQSELK